MNWDMGSTKVISSLHLVKVDLKVRGIPAKNKPNSHRPYYRLVKVFTPVMLMADGQIICHPSLVPKIEAAFREAERKVHRQMIESITGKIKNAFLYGSAGQELSAEQGD